MDKCYIKNVRKSQVRKRNTLLFITTPIFFPVKRFFLSLSASKWQQYAPPFLFKLITVAACMQCRWLLPFMGTYMAALGKVLYVQPYPSAWGYLCLRVFVPEGICAWGYLCLRVFTGGGCEDHISHYAPTDNHIMWTNSPPESNSIHEDCGAPGMDS